MSAQIRACSSSRLRGPASSSFVAVRAFNRAQPEEPKRLSLRNRSPGGGSPCPFPFPERSKSRIQKLTDLCYNGSASGPTGPRTIRRCRCFKMLPRSACASLIAITTTRSYLRKWQDGYELRTISQLLGAYSPVHGDECIPELRGRDASGPD